MNPKESYQVSDELWANIQPLLPKHVNTHRFGGGRPRADDRKCMNGILFVLRTGCQWNALNATGICPRGTAHDRFQKRVQAGVFRKFRQAGLSEYDNLKGVDWSWQSMDAAMTKAPLGGEKKVGPNPTDRAKSGVKRSLPTDLMGFPSAWPLTGPTATTSR